MRTKTLLFAAAAIAAGMVSASAQVYSVNVVGYVKTTIRGNGAYSLVANPLYNTFTNAVTNLFADIPRGSTIFKFVNGGFNESTTRPIPTFLAWTSAMTLVPGEGVFVQLPAGEADYTATFVGEVQQGTLTNLLPQGFSIVSSRVPQAGTLAELGLVGAQNDNVFRWDQAAQTYASGGSWVTFQSAWSSFTFASGVNNTVGVGEAFFISKGNAAGTWVRTFTVAP